MIVSDRLNTVFDYQSSNSSSWTVVSSCRSRSISMWVTRLPKNVVACTSRYRCSIILYNTAAPATAASRAFKHVCGARAALASAAIPVMATSA